MKKKIINLAISVEADARLRCLAVELDQPLGVVLELAILAYQPDRDEPEPTWRETIEARLKALELGKVELVVVRDIDNAILDSIPGKRKQLPDSEFDRLIQQQFILQRGVIRKIMPALRKQGVAVSQKRMAEALKRLELKG